MSTTATPVGTNLDWTEYVVDEHRRAQAKTDQRVSDIHKQAQDARDELAALDDDESKYAQYAGYADATFQIILRDLADLEQALKHEREARHDA